MGRNKPVIPDSKPNPKRTIAKKARGFGQGMFEKTAITEIEWSQTHDPLFKIRGLERHNLLKGK